MIDTNWVIVTGAPRSGKTKFIERLAFEGYRICPEAARIVIDEYASKQEALDCGTKDFERLIFEEKLRAENRFNPKEVVFWDRGPIDSIAFSQLYNRNLEKEFSSKIGYHYKTILFMSELGEYKEDYATIENKHQAVELEKILKKAYKEFGYEMIEVPKMDIESRVAFVKKYIE